MNVLIDGSMTKVHGDLGQGHTEMRSITRDTLKLSPPKTMNISRVGDNLGLCWKVEDKKTHRIVCILLDINKMKVEDVVSFCKGSNVLVDRLSKDIGKSTDLAEALDIKSLVVWCSITNPATDEEAMKLNRKLSHRCDKLQAIYGWDGFIITI